MIRFVSRPATRTREFGWWLLGAVVVGVSLRVVYDVVVLRTLRLGLDSSWYFLEAGVIRNEHAYADPDVFTVDRAATAAWPPLYPALLAAVQSVAGDSIRASQVAGSVLGGCTIALTGLLGRRIAGMRVGLAAAALAAVSPLLIAADGSMMAEALFVPLALATLLLALHAADAERQWWWLAPGAVAGLAALTRAEGLLLIPFVVIPIAWRARVVAATAVALLAAVVVVAPWVARNAVRVDEPSIATVSSSTAIAGANCDSTYAGSALGSWSFACIRDDLRQSSTESDWTATVRRDGLNYAADHATRWPVVGGARVARLWSLWDPADQIDREVLETRQRSWQALVLVTGFGTLILGSAGLVMLARRGRPVAGLVGLLAMVTTVALLTYGNTRFRTTAEPALLIGTAAVVGRALRRGRGVLARPVPG
jgi:4-amino-4-deoxy-L-arabinose transferase-like glycosyltransferase